MPKHTLPEKMHYVLSYMIQGHDLMAEGRHFAFANTGDRYQLGVLATAWNFGQNPEKEGKETIVGIGMSFTHFLSIVQDLTDGDIERIKQINQLGDGNAETSTCHSTME